jgi:hypothetical protein
MVPVKVIHYLQGQEGIQAIEALGDKVGATVGDVAFAYQALSFPRLL